MMNIGFPSMLQSCLSQYTTRRKVSRIPDMKTDITIIGGGVIGCAVAAYLSRTISDQASITLVEKEPTLGSQMSGRNSGVIHAGLYYGKSSKKTRFCIQGNPMLVQFCKTLHVPYAECGKWIVADLLMQAELTQLFDHARSLSVPVHWLPLKDALQTQPNLNASNLAARVLHSPTSGIVDTRRLVQRFHDLAINENHNVRFLTNTHVLGIGQGPVPYMLNMKTKSSSSENQQSNNAEHWTLASKYVINCAGASADQIYRKTIPLVNNNTDDRYHPQNVMTQQTRGHYYKLDPDRAHHLLLSQRLIYPLIPKSDLMHSLGIHTSFDLQGNVRFGPSVDWTCSTTTDDVTLKHHFHQCISKYLTNIQLNQLVYDSYGTRSKLVLRSSTSQDDTSGDFMVDRADRFQLTNWINCIGIQSPGLTACLAIAKYVTELLDLPKSNRSFI